MSANIEIQLGLSPEIHERLQAEANRQQTVLTDLLQEVIEDYLTNSLEEVEDTPNEKILADIREGWQEAMTGQTVPADKALAALRKKLTHDNNQS